LSFFFFILEWQHALCHSLFHPVDDSFLVAQIRYRIEASSATGVLFLLMMMD